MQIISNKRSLNFHLFSLLLICLISNIQAVQAENNKLENTGEKIFKQYCSSCHKSGANIVNNTKPIAGSQKLVSLATFKSYLQYPTGHMPYYQNIVNNKTLIKSLYDYCKSLDTSKKRTAQSKDLPTT